MHGTLARLLLLFLYLIFYVGLLSITTSSLSYEWHSCYQSPLLSRVGIPTVSDREYSALYARARRRLLYNSAIPCLFSALLSLLRTAELCANSAQPMRACRYSRSQLLATRSSTFSVSYGPTVPANIAVCLHPFLEYERNSVSQSIRTWLSSRSDGVRQKSHGAAYQFELT